MEIAVLAVLALNAGTPVSGSSLINILWSQDPPRTAGKTLQGYVKRVRGHVASHGIELTHAAPAGYVLKVEPSQVDATEFESIVAAARTGDDDELRLRRLDDALRLWRGDPFAGCDLDGLQAHREWLLRLRNSTRLERTATQIRLGVNADTISAIRTQLADDPTNERLWLHLAGALYISGNPVAALAVITEARHELDDRVGVALGPELTEFQRRMLDHDDVENTYFRLTGGDRPTRPRAAGLAGPPAESPSGPLSLPQWAGEMVGRDGLISEIVAALDERTSVLTITGPGGFGKTRCAVEAARRSTVGCRGFIDVSALTTVAELELHLAGSFGVPDRDDPVSAVATRLGEAGGIVILDNMEQVVGAASAIRALAERCPSVLWLITSQAELGIGAERVIRLGPLSNTSTPGTASPAAALLVAAARRRGVTVEPDQVIQQIVELVGGIPLALELAAYQLSSLPAAALLRSLTDPVGALVDPRPSIDRHRSMRACFELGVARLSPDATDLFAIVSQRPAGVRYDDLMTWWVRPTALPRAVAELVEVGFASTVLDSTGATRITQVPLVRAFGRTVPLPGNSDAAHAALDAGVFGRAQASMAGTHPSALEPDLADIRRLLQRGLDHPAATESSIQLAVLLTLYWWSTRITEGRRWLDALLDRIAHQGSPMVPYAVHTLAFLDFYVGDAETAARRIDAALSQDLADHVVLARLLALRAMLDAGAGDHATATRRIDRAIALARAAGDEQVLWYALGNAGDVATAGGDSATARTRYVECIDLLRRGGLDWLAAAPHARLGDLAVSNGEYRRARMWFDRSIALWSARDLGPGAPQTLAAHGRLNVLEGDWIGARRQLDAALATAERCGSRAEYPWVVLGYAALLAAQHDNDAAAVLFALGLRHGRAAGQNVDRLIDAELAPLYQSVVADSDATNDDPLVLATPLEDLPLIVAQLVDRG